MRNRILGKKGVSGIMEIILRVVFVVGIAITISLPFSLRNIFNNILHMPRNFEATAFFHRLFGFILIFSILILAFVYCAARIFRTINKNDPFVEENVKNLNAMAILSLLVGLDCWVFSFLGKSIFTVLLGVIFTFLWGLFLVLRELFRSAVQFKHENDFTI